MPNPEQQRPDKVIAVLDDDPDVRELVTLIFNGLGYKAYGANNAQELFDILKNNNVDAISLDYGLRPENGVKIAERLRQTEQYQGIPMMFLTAWWEVPEIAKITRYIVHKPFEVPFLIKTIQQVLADKSQPSRNQVIK